MEVTRQLRVDRVTKTGLVPHHAHLLVGQPAPAAGREVLAQSLERVARAHQR